VAEQAHLTQQRLLARQIPGAAAVLAEALGLLEQEALV
jgi:hypothetical protein